MNDSVKKLQEERNQLYHDYYNNIVPKRMPVSATVGVGLLSEYAGLDLMDVQYDFTLLKDIVAKVCDILYSDTCPFPGAGKTVMYHQSLGSRAFQISSSGNLQHPDVYGMTMDDYDAFIADPFATIVDVIVPKIFTKLDPSRPYDMFKTMAIAKNTFAKDNADSAAILKPILEEKGYYKGAPKGSRTHVLAPMDFLADQCRSMSEISKDVRRCPQKIIDACDAIYPFLFTLMTPSNPDPEGSVRMPLHMPTYMREKDFVNIWLPSYKRMITEWASMGIRSSAYLETDWTRFYDIILDEFPAGMELRLEGGDPRTAKDKLGKKFFLGQMFPVEVIRIGTKEQAVDRCKEFLDIMLPGCGYMFGFDKNPLYAGDVKWDNYAAVMEFARDYAVYDNAGESFGMKTNSEGFSFNLSKSNELRSKYVFDWEKYKSENPFTPDRMRNDLEKYERDMIKFYLELFD